MLIFLDILMQVVGIALVVIGGVAVTVLILTALGVVEVEEMDDEEFL